MSLTNAKIVQIAVTHRAFHTISWTYMEKYVSVHNHHPIIKSANEREIDLIFTGIIHLLFDNHFLIFFSIVTSF